MSVLTRQKRKEDRMEKEQATIISKEETIETIKETTPKREQEGLKRFKLPNVTFESIKEASEVAPISFAIKFSKRKIRLPNVGYEEVKIKDEVSPIRYKIQMKKTRIKLPSVGFEEIKVNNEIETPKWKKKLKKFVLYLPNVDFQRIDFKNEISPIIFKFIQGEVSKMSKEERRSEEYGEETSAVPFGGDFEYYKEEEHEELLKFGILSETLGKDPIIIILIDEEEVSKEFIKDVLKRLVEEYEGEFRGFEEITIVKEPWRDEGAEEERREEVRRFLSVNKKVVIINSESLWTILEKVDNISLADRLNEMKGCGLGFLVFNVKRCDKESVRRLKDIMTAKSIIMLPVTFFYDIIVDILRKHFFLDEISYERDIYEKLRSKIILNQKRITKYLLLVVKRNEGKESDLHYSLKCLTVWHIAKEIKKIIEEEKIRVEDLLRIDEEIKTEYNISKIADVYCDGEVWEVETLLGEGERGGVPIKKIDETIRKWEDVLEIRKINIVVDNITWLLHKRQIRFLVKFWREKLRRKGKDINIWVSDWLKKKLRKVL